MTRWMVIGLVALCLALGGGSQTFAQSSEDKVKAANLRAAQDYLKSGLILAGEGRDAEAVKSFRQAIAIRPDWAEAHSLLGSSLSRPAIMPSGIRTAQGRHAEARLRRRLEFFGRVPRGTR
jgi:Flp pilus assembly protein TadD